MGVLTVSVETLGGATAFGPVEVDASLKIRGLKELFAPERHKKLLVKATDLALEDEDSLPSADSHIFLLVQYVAAPEPQASLPKMDWECNLAEAFSVGDTFGDDDEYTMDKLIGAGSQAQVFACSRRDGSRFAVKVFRKSVLVNKNDEQGAEVENTRGYINFRREVESHESLHHQRIVKVVEVKETEKHLFLRMELGQEDLCHHVKRVGALKEPEARFVFQQLLEGIGFMHSRGVLHRDLKLENLIIDSVVRNSQGWDEISIKIGDFGLSKKVGVGVPPDSPSRHCLESWRPATPPKKIHVSPTESGVPPPLPLIRAITAVGTNSYIAPEVLSRKRRDSGGHYDKEVDYFSLGICLHLMLTGKFLFDSMNSHVGDEESQDQRADDSLLDGEAYKNLPSGAKTLIAGLVRVDAARRFTLADCLASDWTQAQHSDIHRSTLTLERRPSVNRGSQDEGGRSHMTAAGV